MLILSCFPGIDILGLAFEREGWCVVRGPDPIFGGDIHTFHPPAGPWDGVIGGPPCQVFSILKRLNPKAGEKHGNLIPEFERCVEEAQPRWFLMENVPQAPEPEVRGYWPARSLVLNNRWFGEAQERVRRFSFGMRFDLAPHALELDVSPYITLFESQDYRHAVTSSQRAVPVKLGGKVKRTYHAPGVQHGPALGPLESLAEMCVGQGLPPTYLDDCPLTVSGKRKAIGNAVPLVMGRAIARAVRRALAVL